MHFFSAITTAKVFAGLLALSTSLALTTATPAKAPNLTYLFTVTVQVGKVLQPPIPIPGGSRVGVFLTPFQLLPLPPLSLLRYSLMCNHLLTSGVVEPLTGGTIAGPCLNATVVGGVAYPAIYEGRTVQIPEILLYGTATGGANFIATIEGVGQPTLQMARAVSCLPL